ncbi:hypothetical protein CLNEO_01810 [Anaerotignum neopropionicum]|uniref:Uncharacterized protein n=1 Tax=Anaerotignum neopropionicum TaxID=36847 RepID=A0A136WHR8_9FIRM|nr:hypothetical protein CLNEO_01810 [Anaerotignum neopropionicum]
MNCVADLTTQYGLVLIISTILLVLVVIILTKEKNSADCHVRKTSAI